MKRDETCTCDPELQGLTEVKVTAEPWEVYLKRMPPHARAELNTWMAQRPPEIIALMHRFPPGSTLDLGGQEAFIIGFNEYDLGPSGISLSWINPGEDYEGAVNSRFQLCGQHIHLIK